MDTISKMIIMKEVKVNKYRSLHTHPAHCTITNRLHINYIPIIDYEAKSLETLNFIGLCDDTNNKSIQPINYCNEK